MKTVIICGGQPPSKQLLDEELKTSDYIICADKGGEVLYDFGIKPNLLLGDFDSISKNILDYYKDQGVILFKFPPEKDFTDSFLALEKAIELGSEHIVFLGCTGDRVDHILGNVGLLLHSLNCGIECFIRDDNNLIQLINKPKMLKSNGYEFFSLVSYGDTVYGITLEGAKYPLIDYNLKLGETLGISNQFNNEQVEVFLKSGLLLIIQSNDNNF